MAETRVINIRELPGRRLRRRVRVFLEGEEVLVEDSEGQTYGVSLQHNKLMLRPNGEEMNLS